MILRAHRRWPRWAMWLVATQGLFASAAMAQPRPAPTVTEERPCVSPALSPADWSIGAVRRLEALGLVERIPAHQHLTICLVAQALYDGVRNAVVARPELAPLVRSWSERFAEEHAGAVDGGRDPSLGPRVLGSSIGVGYRSRKGGGAPGLGEYPPVRTGVLPLPDESAFRGGIDLAVGLSPRLSVVARPRMEGGTLDWDALDVALGVGGLSLSAGRARLGYGHGLGGGLILSDARLDRVQLETPRAVMLPGILGRLGPFSFNTYLSRLRDDRHPDRPALWGASASVAPHPRLGLAVHRGAMFGGEGVALTPRSLANMLIGRVAGIGFEDQIVSAELRYRLPTDGVLPLTAYVEWGAEDAAGAWWDVPGRVVGVRLPAIPRVPALTLAAEYTSLAPSCCGNPKWYRHWSFPGSWALDDRPLGRALGGEGSELLLLAQLDRPEQGLRLSGAGFMRERGEENLFSPGREGGSRGVTVDLSWRFGHRAELRASAARESGEDWTDRSFAVESRLFLEI